MPVYEGRNLYGVMSVAMEKDIVVRPCLPVECPGVSDWGVPKVFHFVWAQHLGIIRRRFVQQNEHSFLYSAFVC